MKTKILSILAALLFIAANTQAQSDSKTTLPNACATSCWFTDCTVSNCPMGTTPKCKCIFGLFGSCGCQQLTNKAAGTSSDLLPTLKNGEKMPAILAQLNESGYKEYADNLSNLFNALQAKSLRDYNIYFSLIESQINADSEGADKVSQIIASFFK